MFSAVSRAKVLVVDSDTELCELLAHSLRRAGMLVVTAREVAAAVDLLERTQPDLVVLGLDIGTVGGREVLQIVTRRSQAHLAAGLLPVPFTHWQITHDPKYVEDTLRAVSARSSRDPSSPVRP